MGRGLGELQKGILGIAYTINAHTQGGEARVKPADFAGPVDYRTAIGVCLLYSLAPTQWIEGCDPRQYLGDGTFENTPEVLRAKAACSRAATNLVRRGLLAYHANDCGLGGYILTEAGLVIGAANRRPVPLIDKALAFFWFTTQLRWGGRECARGFIDKIARHFAVVKGLSRTSICDLVRK